ncbi:MAG TPA: PAS domain-containing protein [Methanoregulaceae archaeon]|nr:PAS domain-containing protein [Methanoregulaceae archaeon]
MPMGNEVLRGVVSTVEHLPVPAYALDTAGAILAWNSALARLTSVPGEDLVGRDGGIHAAPFVGSAGFLLADLVLDPTREAPGYLSAVECDGDGLLARLTAELSGVRRAFVVRAAPIVAEGVMIGAVEVVLAPLPGAPDPMVTHETVARLLQTARHDIKNELTIVLGYIGLARDSVGDPVTCAGLDRAIAAAGEIGRLIEFTREVGDLGERPPEARNLAALIRDAADSADLSGIDLEIAVPRETVTADPVVFSVFEHLFERLFLYSAATVPRPGAVRVAACGRDPHVVVYEDDAQRTDRRLHPDRGFTRELDRGLAMLRELLSLDGVELSVIADPLRLELRIPGSRVQPVEKEE